jgi:glycosyltransferase involved in cell wall biosynthesis
MSEGILVPFGDADALAESVGRLVIDRNLRSTLGQNARQRVLEQFDIRQVAKSYECLYARTIARARMPLAAHEDPFVGIRAGSLAQAR